MIRTFRLAGPPPCCRPGPVPLPPVWRRGLSRVRRFFPFVDTADSPVAGLAAATAVLSAGLPGDAGGPVLHRGKLARQIGLGRVQREQEAKGEPFDLVKITPPPVPDEQNFAMAPIVMTTYSWILDRNGRRSQNDTTWSGGWKCQLRLCRREGAGGRKLAEGRESRPAGMAGLLPAGGHADESVSGPSAVAGARADVLLALSKYDSVVEELRQAARRPDSRFPLDYTTENPAAILLPHLAGLKGPAMMLQLRAIAELEAGQTDMALEDVQLMLRLAEALRGRADPDFAPGADFDREPGAPARLEGLATTQWSDAQLTVLEQALRQSDFLADYHVAMRGEQVMLVEIIDYYRRTRRLEELDGMGSDTQSVSQCRKPLRLSAA